MLAPFPENPATDRAARPERSHLQTAAVVAHALGVDPETGLSADEVQCRRARHGDNRLPEAPPRGLLRRLLDQFGDFMTLVLLVAAGVSGWIGDWSDTVAILVIVILNALMGLSQEWRADRALQALQRLAAPMAMVRREGRHAEIPADQLVPGDVVLLEAGRVVPADLRLHQVAQLRVDESTLTGESMPVEKQAAPLGEEAQALGDRLNMAYKGTLVAHGRASGLVVATGPRTELGKVAGLLDTQTERSTPLQRRLAAFGRRLSLVVLAVCGLIFALGLLRGEPWMLMGLTAISLAVAAIPEALPAVVTVLLALGARRMVRVQALVRRLPSVETLGSVTTICSDKTGTLTQNRMQVAAHHVAGVPGRAAEQRLWQACLLCNDAQRDAAGAWAGDPTEIALAEGALGAGVDGAALLHTHPRRHEWPFDSERKRMSTLHPAGEGWTVVTKGAPESVLPLCDVEAAPAGRPLERAAVLAQAQAFAARGMRVLAVACRSWERRPDDLTADQVEVGLQLLGLVALVDPPRPQAFAAVAECKSAGIRPVMITGDHPATALAIARELGIAGPGEDRVMTGAELAQLDETQLEGVVGSVPVYARVDPLQKIRIVEALQRRGHYVAMTGDGVNDAPALKRADIGVAMGQGGTDVAREAASLVLLDDNFASIVAAVREGRRIFDNIRKFIRYALSGNSGEIWTLFLAPLLGLPMPLLPIHILWVNLVTDGLPGLALAAEPPEPGVMQRPPRPPDESLFAHGLWQHAVWIGLLIAGLCLAVQAWAVREGGTQGQTLVFMVLTLSQLAHVLAIRSETQSLLSLGLLSNRPLAGAVLLSLVMQLATVYVPPLQGIFHTEALSLAELGVCLACAAVVFLAVEAEKAWRRARGRAARLAPVQ
ncbi:cation-translocating P-type ATPase [Aquabacterium sp. A7-Y]|uniref:cation-translocating P-type ATPase n=1 Tax=Aquabacterium sp. A7-Y TaxID=1349605 RepID=UPI00223E50ED|nr:cation-translocating P-type ATPase [Aquabacterium sp. A7-Y]MCW7540898.1 cation-translocating P-type ATPase [Aquabacterium sp. A7-Y]